MLVLKEGFVSVLIENIVCKIYIDEYRYTLSCVYLYDLDNCLCYFL